MLASEFALRDPKGRAGLLAGGSFREERRLLRESRGGGDAARRAGVIGQYSRQTEASKSHRFRNAHLERLCGQVRVFEQWQ